MMKNKLDRNEDLLEDIIEDDEISIPTFTIGLGFNFLSSPLVISLKNIRAKNSGLISRIKQKKISDYQIFLKRELLFVHLLDVFEDSEKGERWLHEPNGALDNQRPIDFTNNSEGIEKVDKILGRIEHGIFS